MNHSVVNIIFSKALRCTFFGERKNSCSSKFVQLLLLNRVKARCSENRAAQGFHFINSFISNYFGPNSKTCTWEVRAARGRVSQGLTVSLPLVSINSKDKDDSSPTWMSTCSRILFLVLHTRSVQCNMCYIVKVIAQGGVSSRAIHNWLWIFSLFFAKKNQTKLKKKI